MNELQRRQKAHSWDTPSMPCILTAEHRTWCHTVWAWPYLQELYAACVGHRSVVPLKVVQPGSSSASSADCAVALLPGWPTGRWQLLLLLLLLLLQADAIWAAAAPRAAAAAGDLLPSGDDHGGPRDARSGCCCCTPPAVAA